jgi:hypothetical protein
MACEDNAYDELMVVVPQIFRAVALLLVLYIGVQVVTCDAPGSDCSSFATQNDHKQPAPTDAGDNCICCCAHPAPVPLFASVLLERLAVPAYFSEPVAKPHTRPSEIEHPPQLS